MFTVPVGLPHSFHGGDRLLCLLEVNFDFYVGKIEPAKNTKTAWQLSVSGSNKQTDTFEHLSISSVFLLCVDWFSGEGRGGSYSFSVFCIYLYCAFGFEQQDFTEKIQLDMDFWGQMRQPRLDFWDGRLNRAGT